MGTVRVVREVQKPFVLCADLDGVVADYETALRKVVATETGRDESELGPQLSWDFSECNWGIRDRDHFFEMHHKAVVEYRMFSTMPAIEGASDALWRLSDAGVWVRIVTHRLVVKNTHHVAVADTVSWLQQPRPDGRPLIPYRDICFIGDKSEVGGDCFIDDAPHNVIALREAGYPCLVMDAGYNQHIEGPRVSRWDQIEKIVLDAMHWRDSNPLRSAMR